MNSESKMADWVAYCADKNNLINDNIEQNRDWEKDPDLPGLFPNLYFVQYYHL